MKTFQKKYYFLAIIATVSVILDQITKYLAIAYLKFQPAYEVVAGFFHLKYVENPGAAWGFLANSDSNLRTPFFIIVSILAIGFIIFFFSKLQDQQYLLAISLSSVMGGALGNFIDRLRFNYVVDFIDWHWKELYHWPTFNIADAAITIGVILMFLDMFWGPKELVKE